MKRTTGNLSRGYRCLLRLYPAPFRAEFGAEMDEVFAQAVGDAAHRGRGAVTRLCLRELQSWPGALGREWGSSLQARLDREKGGIVEGRPSSDDLSRTMSDAGTPGPWTAALLAALALLVPGLALAPWPLPAPWHRVLVFGSYLLILVGLLAGWVKGFPRWSYAYVGHAVVFALWLSHSSTPGLEVLGYRFARHEVWGGRAWLGLATMAVLALLLTRSLRPVARFFAGMWRDWTCLSLMVYGCLPFLMGALFDEVHAPYRIPFLIATSLCLAAGALGYMRGQTMARRMLWLLGGLTAAWLAGGTGLSIYWNGPRVPGRAPFRWYKTAVPMAGAWVVVAAALVAPVVLGVVRRVVPGRRAA